MDTKGDSKSNFPPVDDWDRNIEANISHNFIVTRSKDLFVPLNKTDNLG